MLEINKVIPNPRINQGVGESFHPEHKRGTVEASINKAHISHAQDLWELEEDALRVQQWSHHDLLIFLCK